MTGISAIARKRVGKTLSFSVEEGRPKAVGKPWVSEESDKELSGIPLK